MDNYIFNEKLLLIGEDGANLITRSKPIAFFADGKYWVNNHAHCIDSTEKNILEYICLYINSIKLEKYVTGAAQPKMNQENMNNIFIPLPPFNEQINIFKKVRELNNIIDSFNNLNINLFESINSLKSKILDLAIRGKLAPQDPNDEPADVLLERIRKEKEELIKQGKIKRDKKESIIFKGDDNSYYEKISEDDYKNIDNILPFNIPNNWVWCRLGTLIQIINGVSYDKKDVGTGNIRILRGGNINNLKIEIFDDDVFLPQEYYDTEKQLQQNDIVIVASTGSKEIIGKPGFITTTIDETMIGAFLRIIRPISLEITSYVQLIFSSDYYRNHIRKLVHGNTINNIKTEYISNLIIPIPPQNEIVKIIDLIKSNMNLINQIEKGLS